MSQHAARSLDKLHRAKLANLRKSNQFFAHIEDVHEQEGFNPRNYDLPGVQEHIRSLADAYKAGRYVDPITVQVLDGKIVVRDGHCRRRGMLLAQEEGADLGQVPMNEFRGDEVEADALILTSQSGKRLSAVEVALMYSRMKNRGKTEAQIAELVGKSTQHVRDYLDFHTFPADIKALVEQETVSYSLACKAFNELGSGAVEALKNGVEEQIAKGKRKLTGKSLEAQRSTAAGGRPVRITKKVATRMASHITTWASQLDAIELREDGSAVLELTAEEVAALRELRESLPPEEPITPQPSSDGNETP